MENTVYSDKLEEGEDQLTGLRHKMAGDVVMLSHLSIKHYHLTQVRIAMIMMNMIIISHDDINDYEDYDNNDADNHDLAQETGKLQEEEKTLSESLAAANAELISLKQRKREREREKLELVEKAGGYFTFLENLPDYYSHSFGRFGIISVLFGRRA